MPLRVRYHRLDELSRDHSQQLSRGGLLVRAEYPESLQQFEPVTLVLVTPSASISLDAQVVQIFPGVGVAVTFPANEALAALVAKASSISADGPDAEHEWVDDTAAEDESPRSAGSGPPAVNPIAEKMTMALRGNRDERATILREGNPTLHTHVLRNPGLQLDEVANIAKMRTVTAELLKLVADRREWVQRPEIAIALVRNPKTPLGVAIRLLDHVSAGDLRQLAKDTHTRTPIQQAARKKVLGA